MKRPYLVHFLAVMTEENMAVKASIALKDNPLNAHLASPAQEIESFKPRFPIQAYKLLGASPFSMLVIGLNHQHKEVFRKTYESDAFGNFNFKIPLTGERQGIEVLQIYEVSFAPGLELILGNYLPLKIMEPKKLIVCDFDKTLVDTRYSSTREVYNSLTRPIDYFPTVPNSVKILRHYIRHEYHPFILSASPHFYEDAMRDWLYHNKIFTAGIFLKDYRQVFSLFEGDLSPKDIKNQGLYKLNHLLDILIMTGVPDQLILMGDNFESDPIIYLALAKMLREDLDPWYIWRSLKKQDVFMVSKKQDSLFLNKIYQLTNLVNRRDGRQKKRTDLKIFIRKKAGETEIPIPQDFQSQIHLLSLFHGVEEIPPEVLPQDAEILNEEI